MGSPTKVIAEPIRVDQELFQLGLEREGLWEVLRAARWARMSCSAYDPPGFTGWSQYGVGVRSLRQLLMEQEEDKWTKCDRGGFCRTIRPDDGIAIAVSSGDEDTGDPNGTPKTKNPKGPKTIHALEVNRSQLELFPEDQARVDARIARHNEEPILWFLLVNVRNGEVFGELSLPVEVDRDGRASHWDTRIMLPPTSTDGPGGRERHEPDGEPDIDIDVRRRAS